VTFPLSRSPSPPPPPDSPELTIDERPLAERISATPSPKVVISIPEEMEHQPKSAPPSPNQSNRNRVADSHVEVSPRYRKKSIYFPPYAGLPTLPQDVTRSSSSESSSADELVNLHHCRDREHPTGKGRSISLCIDSRKDHSSLDMSKPLSLMVGGFKDRQRSQSVSLSSPSAILSNLDSARVKIMEGGFESNEDYTYVRGRGNLQILKNNLQSADSMTVGLKLVGRGRYVCESCGIRCKKPSMLRKHLKTHTDLRPYTCKLCNFR